MQVRNSRSISTASKKSPQNDAGCSRLPIWLASLFPAYLPATLTNYFFYLLKKSLRLPQLFVQAGDSAVRPPKAGETDHAVEAGRA